MIELSIAAIAAIVGYLFGSLSFAHIIGRVVAPNEDLSHTEFSVPGHEARLVMPTVSATTLSVRKGPGIGCITSILDIAKVAIPTLAFQVVYPGMPYALFAAAAGVAGHNWPLFFKFKGGSGLSAIVGGLLVFDWVAIFVPNILGILIGLVLFRDVLLAYIAGTILLIPWFWLQTGDPWHVAYAFAVNAFLLIAMRSQLDQYIRLKRAGKVPDLMSTLSATDMGKGMQAILDRIRLIKK